MKLLKRLLFSLFIVGLISSCSTKENYNDLLHKIMVQRMGINKFLKEVPYKDTIYSDNGDICFYVETETDRYSLRGNYQLKGGYLVFKIFEEFGDGIAMNDLTGIYEKKDGNWTTIFKEPLVYGTIDTIIDLNNDKINEVLINVRTTKSRGKDPCDKLVLYAQKNSSLLEEVGVLAERINEEFKLVKDFTLSFEPASEGVILVVNSTEGDDLNSDENANPDINDNPPKTTVHRFSWQPPLLVDLNMQENQKLSLDDQRRIATNQDVKIGEQTWMVTNLNVTNFRNGDSIPQARTVDEWNLARQNQTPAWCNYNDEDSKWYNWYAVNDPRGLAPEGWHIPSDAEWTQLVEFLGGGKSAIAKLKSTDRWDPKEVGTNESGFSAKPDGAFDGTWEFSCGIGVLAEWWTSTEASPENAWSWSISSDSTINHSSKSTKDRGISVRCIKD